MRHDSFKQEILQYKTLNQKQISDILTKHYRPRGPKHKMELFSSLLGEMETHGEIRCVYDDEGIVLSLRVLSQKKKMVYQDFQLRAEHLSGIYLYTNPSI